MEDVEASLNSLELSDSSLQENEGERDEDEIRIVLVGRTGAGKSATGNTILGFEQFKSKPSGSSVTETCQRVESQYKGHKLVLVDTPGLFDTKLKPGEVTKEIITCIEMSKPGPHVFLLVLRYDRFTNEEIQTFKSLFEIFGENMKQFAVITFTRLDDLEQNNVLLSDFIQGSNDELKNLIDQCGNRYIGFNNKASEKQKQGIVSSLFELVDRIQKDNQNNHYTNAMYEEAEAHLLRKLEEAERLKELEKAKEIERIKSEYKDQVKEIKDAKKKLEKVLVEKKQQMKYIKLSKDKTERALQNKLKEMEKEHQQENLPRLEEEKERMEKNRLEYHAREAELQKSLMDTSASLRMVIKRLKQMEIEKAEALKSVENSFDRQMRDFVKTILEQNKNQAYLMRQETEKRDQEFKKKMDRKDEQYQRRFEKEAQQNCAMMERMLERIETRDMYQQLMTQQAQDFNKKLGEIKNNGGGCTVS